MSVWVCVCAEYVYVIVCMCMSAYVSVCRYTVCMSMHVYVYKFMQVVCDGICVCMYACMYACMYVCLHVCMPACMYACMYVCLHACVHILLYIRENIVTAHMSPYACAVYLLSTSPSKCQKHHKQFPENPTKSLCLSVPPWAMLRSCQTETQWTRRRSGRHRPCLVTWKDRSRVVSNLRMVEERGRKYTRLTRLTEVNLVSTVSTCDTYIKCHHYGASDSPHAV